MFESNGNDMMKQRDTSDRDEHATHSAWPSEALAPKPSPSAGAGKLAHCARPSHSEAKRCTQSVAKPNNLGRRVERRGRQRHDHGTPRATGQHTACDGGGGRAAAALETPNQQQQLPQTQPPPLRPLTPPSITPAPEVVLH